MILKNITFTGVDWKTDIDELREIQKLYPYVEWGVLVTIYEQGVDNGDYRRYNGAEWMKEYSQDILRKFNEKKEQS